MNTSYRTAKEYHEMAEAARRKNAWDILFEEIEKAAKRGNTVLFFDEERNHVKFTDSRKVVKDKLEALGFKVEYRRVFDTNSDIQYSYHNQYSIYW